MASQQDQKKTMEKKQMTFVRQEAVPAEVMQLMGRGGVKGVMQVRCKVTSGRDEGKVLVRNVVGPVRVGDILMLRETEMESAGGMER